MEKKLTVMEAAKLLGVSKEAIYNRLRRGTLNCVVEEGVKYIVLGKSTKKETHMNVRKSDATVENAYVSLLKEQLEELKAKNERLEMDKERLIADKERFLIESKEKIERIYKERDEQLKTILSLANRQLVHTPSSSTPLSTEHHHAFEEGDTSTKEDAEEADVIEEEQREEELSNYTDWRDLRSYLKEKGFAKKEKEPIKETFEKKMTHFGDMMDEGSIMFVKKGKKLKEILGD